MGDVGDAGPSFLGVGLEGSTTGVASVSVLVLSDSSSSDSDPALGDIGIDEVGGGMGRAAKFSNSRHNGVENMVLTFDGRWRRSRSTAW